MLLYIDLSILILPESNLQLLYYLGDLRHQVRRPIREE
jgi:hypothetical protein